MLFVLIVNMKSIDRLRVGVCGKKPRRYEGFGVTKLFCYMIFQYAC